MIIESVTVEVVEVPLDSGYVAGGQAVSSNCHVLARIRTKSGVEGFGYIVKQRPQLIHAVAQATRELGAELVGMNVMDVELAWQSMAKKAKWVGPGGFLHWAMAPLDIAMWDAAGKALGQPLYRMLGGFCDNITAYGSDRLWYSLSLDELGQSAQDHAANGFTGLKLRLGRDFTIAEQVQRAKIAAEGAGPGVEIMVDGTESWDLPYARMVGRALQDAGVTWLEDPVHHDDLNGLASLTAALDIPVTGAENLYTLAEFRNTMEAKALDIAILDLARVGGVTPWRKIASLMEAYNMPVCGHVMPEVHVHLLAAVSHGHKVEYMPRSTEILQNMPVPVKGVLSVPEGPGHGLKLDEAAVKRFTVN
jgi:L-alanine-DL-glutamate epimerase-like enolase superfamily enzyme